MKVREDTAKLSDITVLYTVWTMSKLYTVWTIMSKILPAPEKQINQNKPHVIFLKAEEHSCYGVNIRSTGISLIGNKVLKSTVTY